jgi:ABC-2 type transport system permease protein
VTVLIALLVVYVVATFFFMSGVLFQQLCTPLADAGYGWLYFSLMGILVFALCFVGSIFATQSQLFGAKDNDLLLSLPIRPFSILLSRITALLLLDYLFEAFIVIPAGVIWLVYQPAAVVGIVFFIIAAVILPLPALALGRVVRLADRTHLLTDAEQKYHYSAPVGRVSGGLFLDLFEYIKIRAGAHP